MILISVFGLLFGSVGVSRFAVFQLKHVDILKILKKSNMAKVSNF